MAASIEDFGFLLPTHFPYEVESAVNETESSDDDDFVAGLTGFGVPCLENRRGSAGSPQSTLSGIGSWSGNGSPKETTPFRESYETWELIYAAAGQVARLKNSNENRELMGPLRTHNPVLYSNQLRQRQVQIQSMGRPLDLSHAAWPPLQRQHQNQPPRTHGGAVPKRVSAGTGVFLPRQHVNPPDYRKKGGCAPVLVPAKVMQALNFSFSNGNINSHPPSYEAPIGRSYTRSPESRRSHETVILPQEWTY